MDSSIARRSFLSIAGASGAAFAASEAFAKVGGGAKEDDLSREVGRKFYPDGRVHPFRGNTVVCHLDQQGPNSDFFYALLDIYRQLPAQRFWHKITPLPPSSYHMTIFGGANDPDRKPEIWPRDIPLDTPIDECSRILGDRLKAAAIGTVAPLRLRIDETPMVQGELPMTIRLLPIDDAENKRLRDLRDRLSDIFGIRSPNHDRYRFHVTLAYLIRHLARAEQKAFEEAYAHHHADLAKRFPVVEIGQPEYCLMDDMFAFHRQFYI